MAKRKPASKAMDAKPKRVAQEGLQATDAFANALGRMGAGSPSLAEGTEYPLIRISNDYQLMLSLYRNHWIARKIVDVPAQDMIKAWPRISSVITPEDHKLLDRRIAHTGTKASMLETLKWARLFGGAGSLMVIDGQEDMLDQPLDIESVTPGSYRGLIPFDRWSGITPSSKMCLSLETPRHFGLPESYQIQTSQYGRKSFNVHASRIIRFTGPAVPNPELTAQSMWGISVIEPVFEELRKRDNMSWSILQLSFRASILAQKNPDLAQILSGASASQEQQKRFWATMQTQNELLSNQSMMILGKDGELQGHQYSFGGIAEVYQQYQLDVSGAANIPVTKLYGRTLTGLGQSNDADMEMYDDDIAQKQNTDMRPVLEQQLFPVIFMSEFGEVPDDLDFDFPSVRTMSEKDKYELVKNGTDATVAGFTAGIYSQRAALIRLRNVDDMAGLPLSISDEMIEQADDKVQAMGDLSLGGEEGFAEAKEDGEQSESDKGEEPERSSDN